MRYEKQALAWWFHDVFVHPLSGTIGLVGNLLRSFRLMALAHHLHNGTAPTNDSVGDYLDAARRACHNESPDDPLGSRSPDEMEWTRAQAARLLGKEDYHSVGLDEADYVLRSHNIRRWDPYRTNFEPPTLLTESEVKSPGRKAMEELRVAKEELDAFLDRKFTQWQIRVELGEEGVEALRAQAEGLRDRVEKARKKLADQEAAVSVSEILSSGFDEWWGIK